ncbi:MAG: hypothetical protein V6Z78_03920 [Holosporaceae bacterium]
MLASLQAEAKTMNACTDKCKAQFNAQKELYIKTNYRRAIKQLRRCERDCRGKATSQRRVLPRHVKPMKPLRWGVFHH